MVVLVGLVFLYFGDDGDEVGDLNGGFERRFRRLSSRFHAHLPLASLEPEQIVPPLVLLFPLWAANRLYRHDGLQTKPEISPPAEVGVIQHEDHLYACDAANQCLLHVYCPLSHSISVEVTAHTSVSTV